MENKSIIDTVVDLSIIIGIIATILGATLIVVDFFS